MGHVLYRATVALATPLGTPLAGDTLFGQACWALRAAQGEAELTRRLDGYLRGRPWVVFSDGFPAGHLPKPVLPQHFEPVTEPVARKAAKRRRWIPAHYAGSPLAVMLQHAVGDAGAYGAAPVRTVQAHNTLDRLTGSTGKGDFAPYSTPQTFHAAGQRIDFLISIDEERASAEEISGLLAAIGAGGFGRDASTGLGKFIVEGVSAAAAAAHRNAAAFWTLAPCAPQGQGFDAAKSYWRVLTRFGRHGAAHALGANPFKTPVLLAAAGAVFAPVGGFSLQTFIGKGFGGDGRLSKTERATVHQGYAPVLPLAFEETRA